MNLRAALLTSALLISMGTFGSVASATTIIFGTGADNNAFPFGTAFYVGEYQQIYDGSLFSGPVDITQIAFFAGPTHPGDTISGNFALHLSTTSTGVNSLSTVYANNIGANNALFFSGVVSNVLSFSGGPFLFDPSQGNLLLDVNVISANPGFNFFASGCAADTNRVFNLGGSGAVTIGFANCPSSPSFGLQTQFTFTPAQIVPEPASIEILAAGLLGVFGLGALRRRKAQV